LSCEDNSPGIRDHDYKKEEVPFISYLTLPL